MYTLFNEPRVVSSSGTSSARFDYVKAMHRKNLERVVSHYRRNIKPVRSDHLLVQLLQHIPLDLDLSLLVFRDRVRDLVDELVRNFKLTSSVNVGRSFSPGVFYGDDTEELIVVTEEDFDLNQVTHHWEELSPVRFLSHPKTDLSLTVPFGEGYSQERGQSVILLNLPLLACQYREWYRRELSINPDTRKTTMQFVAAYPLVNALVSQHDIAFLNRLTKVFYGDEVSDVQGNHPFFLNTRNEETDDGLLELVKRLERRRLNFGELLEVIEPIHAISFRNVIELPKMALTRQVMWALTVARLPVIAFLLHWGEVVGNHRSYQDVNRIKRSLRQLTYDRSLDQISSVRLAEDVRVFIDTEIRPFI